MKHRIAGALLALVVGLGVALSGLTPATAQNANFYKEATFSSAVVLAADAQSAATRGWADATLAAFQLSCTEDSGTATLDVTIQRSIDRGTTWVTIVTFTQLAATGSETKLYADVRSASPQMIGDRLRANYDITGTGQYTCTLAAAAEA